MHTINNIVTLKSECDWDELDKRMAQLNAKAMNVLYCTLSVNEFSRISSCATTKEIWDRLEVTHEGTNQVKETKINMLVHKYELFRMESNETITDMFTRFTDIINNLKNLEKLYTDSDLCRKILRSLLRTWESKVTAILEAKDLSSLKVEELIGSLMTHAISLSQHIEEEVRRKKKKGIALNANIEGESDREKVESDLSESEVAFLARKFRKFMQRKKFFPKKKNALRKEVTKEVEKKLSICYECNKIGHLKIECPHLPKDARKKKKAFMAAWGDSEDSSFEDEQSETANLCFMTNDDEVCSTFHDDIDVEELLDDFNKLLLEYKKLNKKKED